MTHAEERDAPGWRGAVRDALARGPEPSHAAETADRVLTALPEAVVGALDRAPVEIVTALFASLCGVAPFFGPFLVRYPDWLAQLAAEDLAVARTREGLAAALDAALAEADAEAATVLRRFKYRELARLTVRDCHWLALEQVGTTLRELSALADVLLDRSLAIAAREVASSWGPPRWQSESLRFAVLGLGKLGSDELNYSSDVDLIYIFEAPAAGVQLGDGAKIEPAEYFTRLAQRFARIVGASSADGFLYRIDLDLRPDSGSLVISDAALATYYETRADTWEKAAFMKARPVAGDIEFGWRTIRSLDAMIYRSSMDYGGVQSIATLKSKIASHHGGLEGAFNVKLDAGGIRDIEFIAQSLQLLHGGRISQVRARSTQDALERLAGAGVLPPDAVEELLAAYRFLRRLENRLQMEAERQTHVLAETPAAHEKLARAMDAGGGGDAGSFDAALARHRERVLAHFEAFCPDQGGGRILELFVRNAPQLAAMEPTRSMIEGLAEQLARAIESSPDSELALNNLDRFLHGVGQRRFYLELLIDRPELVQRLAALFSASQFLSNVLASHPTLIEPVFDDPAVLIPTRGAMKDDLAELIHQLDPEDTGNPEARLDGLRLFKFRQILNAGLLDIAEEITRAEAEAGLTQTAEVCLEAALGFAEQALAERPGGVSEAARKGSFLVVAMGKLASRELSYGSDLDVIFLFDTPDPDDVLEAQEYFVRLAQRLISTLQTSTTQGSCYEIDARLRPSGNQGLLVTSLASFRRYHEKGAEAWERQALLRARPIVGGRDLADAFAAHRREILLRPSADPAAEIHRIRLRMEDEIANETSARRDFKTGRGGVLDVETAVQYLQLAHARECEALLEVDRVEVQLDRLRDGDFLAPELHRTLREGWEFLQRLGNRLRIVENRSISDLDAERGDLEGLARRLGYGGEAGGGARRALLRDYAHHTEAIRRVYCSVLGAEE